MKTLWIDWDNPKARNTVYIATRTLLLMLATIGLVLGVRQRWRLVYPALVVGALVALYTVTITAARFTIPIEPLGFCLVGGVCVAAFGLWKRKVRGVQLRSGAVHSVEG